MAPIPGVHVETLRSPVHYSERQLDRACMVAFLLQRGRFVLCEPPENPLDEVDELP